MRKFAFIAVGLALGWIASWTAAPTLVAVAPPASSAGIAPFEMMVGSANLPSEHFVDYSLVYP